LGQHGKKKGAAGEKKRGHLGLRKCGEKVKSTQEGRPALRLNPKQGDPCG